MSNMYQMISTTEKNTQWQAGKNVWGGWECCAFKWAVREADTEGNLWREIWKRWRNPEDSGRESTPGGEKGKRKASR